MADNKKMVEAITSMDTDFAQWYTDVVKKAELADYSGVKGCMVIRPYGYAIWENIQRDLDARFKALGHENVYMPMFIPESLLQKEKDHVEGFAPECAWVTVGGQHQLSERLCVPPTKRCSASTSRTSFIPTETFPSSITNGSMWSGGKKPPVLFCAPPNSSGRRDTPCTQPRRKPKKKLCRC